MLERHRDSSISCLHQSTQPNQGLGQNLQPLTGNCVPLVGKLTLLTMRHACEAVLGFILVIFQIIHWGMKELSFVSFSLAYIKLSSSPYTCSHVALLSFDFTFLSIFFQLQQLPSSSSSSSKHRIILKSSSCVILSTCPAYSRCLININWLYGSSSYPS